MANIFFKFWRIGSAVLVTLILLFCYTSLPDNIAIGFDEGGNPISYTDKQSFFYWSAGIILGVNFLINALSKSLEKLDFRKMLGNTSWGQNPGSAKSLLSGWFSALLAFINTYLVFVLLGLYNINSDKYQMLNLNYNYILLIGVLILLIIIIFLPYKLLATQAALDED